MFDRRRRQSFKQRLESLARRLEGIQTDVQEDARRAIEIRIGREAKPEASPFEGLGEVRHVLVPEVEKGGKHVRVDRWIVREGDMVSKGDPLAHLEYEPWTLEIPSPDAGRVERRLVRRHGEVGVGQPFVMLRVFDTEAPRGAEAPRATAPTEEPEEALAEAPEVERPVPRKDEPKQAAWPERDAPAEPTPEPSAPSASAGGASKDAAGPSGKDRPHPSGKDRPHSSGKDRPRARGPERPTTPPESATPDRAAPGDTEVSLPSTSLDDLLERTRVPLPDSASEDAPADTSEAPPAPEAPRPEPAPEPEEGWTRDEVASSFDRRAEGLTPDARRHLDRFRGLARPVPGDDDWWMVAQCGVALLLYDPEAGTFATGRLWGGGVEAESLHRIGGDLRAALVEFPPDMGLPPVEDPAAGGA